MTYSAENETVYCGICASRTPPEVRTATNGEMSRSRITTNGVSSWPNLRINVKFSWIRENAKIYLGNIVVLAERFQMVIEVRNSVFVSFTSQFRDFHSKLENVGKSTRILDLRESAHPSLLHLLESSFSVSLLVTTAT